MLKYNKESLTEAVNSSFSYADVARFFKIKPYGGAQAHLKSRIHKYGISTSHFNSKAWSKGKKFPNRKKPIDKILIKLPEGSSRCKTPHLRRALLESGIEEKCSICTLLPYWNNKVLKLEIDHIDGDYLNNNKENLRWLCHNCHSQTKTFKNNKRIN